MNYSQIYSISVFGALVFGDIEYDFGGGLVSNVSAKIEPIWKYMSIFHPSTFINKDVYNKLGLYSTDYRYAMDCECLHRFYKWGARFVHYPQVTSTMLVGGLSGQHYIKATLEFFRSSIKYNGFSISTFYYVINLIVKKTILKIIKRNKW